MTASEPPSTSATSPRSGLAWTYLLAALAGALAFLSFPPADLWPLAWVALVPYFVAVRRCSRPRHALGVTCVYGLVFMASFFQYLTMYGSLPWLALAAVQAALYAPLGPVLYALWRRWDSLGGRVLTAAACYTLIEAARGNLGNLSLTLGSFGHTQHSFLPVLQLASLCGALGITFLLAAVNAALAEALLAWRGPARPRARAALVTALGAAATVAVWGGARVSLGARGPAPARTYLVEAVQGNVAQGKSAADNEAVRAAEVYETLTRTSAAGADLIVWPESALPVVFDYPPEAKYRDMASSLARDLRCHLLVGAAEKAPQGKIYNTAFLFDPAGQIVGRYYKDHLVMFGEYVPWRDKLPFLQRYPIRMVDYMPGGERSLVQAGDLRLGVLICFEGLFPEAIRDVCRRGAQVLSVITSDAWAEGTYEVYQHSATGVRPAVESGKWVVRAATTGRSAIISPYGQVMSSVPEFQSGTASCRVPATEGLSVCHRGGWAALLLFCAAIVIAAIARKEAAP